MKVAQEMLEKKIWAVVGITADTEKFGYKIPMRLKNHGYDVVGVNPKYAGQKIDEISVFASLKDISHQVQCVDVLVGPIRAISVIEEAAELGIEYLWFQPGSFDDAVIQKANEKKLKYVDDACVYAMLRHD